MVISFDSEVFLEKACSLFSWRPALCRPDTECLFLNYFACVCQAGLCYSKAISQNAQWAMSFPESRAHFQVVLPSPSYPDSVLWRLTACSAKELQGYCSPLYVKKVLIEKIRNHNNKPYLWSLGHKWENYHEMKLNTIDLNFDHNVLKLVAEPLDWFL